VDWLAFIASLIGSLVWPALVLVLVVLFRDELRPLLARPIHRAKAGPVEVEWEERVEEARVELARSPEAAEQPPDGANAYLRTGPVDRAPRGSILAAFAEIEQALRRTLEEAHVDIGPARRQGMSQLVDQAVAARVISEQTAHAIRGLIVLRNLAAHGGEEIDAAKAEEYLALANGVLYALEAARRELGEGPG
jgi:hypothetical protein